MRRSYFTTNEYVFAAMMAAAFMVVSLIVIPLTRPLGIPGLANIAYAPFSSFMLAIALVRLRRPGSLLLVTGIYAAACLVISPIITTFILASSLVAEGVCSAVFRGYRRPAAVFTGCVLQPMASFPASLLGLYLFGTSQALARAMASYVWNIVLIVEALIFLAAGAGALLGLKVARELEAAGKLAAPDEAEAVDAAGEA